ADIDNEHRACSGAVVLHRMRPTIVEKYAFARFPAVRLRFDDEPRRIVCRHAQPQMITEIAEVWTFVLGDRLARIENREKRLDQVGNTIQDAAGFRTARPIRFGPMTEDLEQ